MAGEFRSPELIEKDEFLDSYQVCNRNISFLCGMIRRLEEQACCLDFTWNNIINKYGINDENIKKEKDYQKRITYLIGIYNDEKIENLNRMEIIEKYIGLLPEGVEKNILRRRYVLGQTPREIWEELFFSRARYFELQRNAMKKLPIPKDFLASIENK